MGHGAISEIQVSGDNIPVAQGRLDYVFTLIESRREELNTQARGNGLPLGAVRYIGPTFQVHVTSLAALMGDDLCRSYLEHVARNGARCGVVVLIYGLGPNDDPASVMGKAGFTLGVIAAACAEGRVFRPAPATAPPPSWMRRPETVEQAEHYSEALSAELWAALALQDYAGLLSVMTHVRECGETPAGPTERRLVADALRRAADILLPGSGGMLPGAMVECPLCLAAPMLRPDEVPSHLIRLHANLAEGMRS